MYVMQYHRLSWEDALHLVQNRRYCISPNGGFLTQIKVCLLVFRSLWRVTEYSLGCQEYESIYKANLAVASFPAQARQARRKRADDEDDNDRPYVPFAHVNRLCLNLCILHLQHR